MPRYMRPSATATGTAIETITTSARAHTLDVSASLPSSSRIWCSVVVRPASTIAPTTRAMERRPA